MTFRSSVRNILPSGVARLKLKQNRGAKVSKPFSYAPLDPSRGDIRLLDLKHLRSQSERLRSAFERLAPTSSAQPISIRLIQVSLEKRPRYHALSYAWGDLNKLRPISVNGAVFHVTENLEAALRQFSVGISGDIFKCDFIWVDALCINQQDDSEKSGQVGKMSSIFSQAHSVLVWLGPHEDGSELAFQRMEYAREVHPYGIFDYDAIIAPESITQEYIEPISTLLEELASEVEKSDGTLLRSFSNIFGRSWWHRVWVYQEFTLAADVHFICGEDSVHSSLIRDLHILLLLADRHRMFYKSDWPLDWLEYLRTALLFPVAILLGRHGPPGSLLELLSWTTTFRGLLYRLRSSDPRDQVFALLDTIPSNMRCAIQADYSKSCREVFIDVALKLYAEVLYVLSYCELLPGSLKKGIPSWAPDWSEVRVMPIAADDLKIGRYAASKSVDTSGQCLHYVGEGVLSLRGVLVDSVLSVHEKGQEVFSGVEEENAKIKNSRKWSASIVSAASRSRGLQDTPKSSYDVIEATLKATTGLPGCAWNFPHSSEDIRAMEAWFRAMMKSNNSSGISECDASGLYLDFAHNYCEMRRPFVTSQGYVGSASEFLKVDDEVWIFPGMNIPVILRPSSGCRYQLVSEAYVHGLMFGEYFEPSREIRTVELF